MIHIGRGWKGQCIQCCDNGHDDDTTHDESNRFFFRSFHCLFLFMSKLNKSSRRLNDFLLKRLFFRFLFFVCVPFSLRFCFIFLSSMRSRADYSQRALLNDCVTCLITLLSAHCILLKKREKRRTKRKNQIGILVVAFISLSLSLFFFLFSK